MGMAQGNPRLRGVVQLKDSAMIKNINEYVKPGERERIAKSFYGKQRRKKLKAEADAKKVASETHFKNKAIQARKRQDSDNKRWD